MGTDGDPLEQLRRALDRLVEVDPGALADGQAVVEIHRQLARLEAVATRSSAAFDRTGRWRADGARTPAAWLAARCSLPEATARRRVRRGRDLPHLPGAERAWLEGDSGSSAVEQLTRARNGTTADQLAADEPELVRYARRLHPRAFARLVGHWRMAADPDGVEDEGEALHAARRVHLSASFAGTWFLDGVLDPVGAEVVATALARVGDELFRADWAAARAEHGDAATADRLGRTPAQRRADAFVELCRRSMSVPAGARAPRPLFTVVLDRPSLGRVCELARSRTPVAPGALVPWLAEADLERVVFDGADRVLAVGAGRRFFTGADRRAVEVRDGECVHPCCDVPAEDCEVDHVVPFAEGGPTTADNGRLACGFHNRSRPGASRPERSDDEEDEDERGPP
jgi:hypothetical protein